MSFQREIERERGREKAIWVAVLGGCELNNGGEKENGEKIYIWVWKVSFDSEKITELWRTVKGY